MKKTTLSIILVLITLFTSSVGVFANEDIRPSISVSAPNNRFVLSGSDVRYTIELASAHNDRLILNPSLVQAEGFSFDDIAVIKLSENVYDVFFKNVKPTADTNICSIICLKGTGSIEDEDLQTIQTPKSFSFFIYNNTTKRREVADYLIQILNINDYSELISSGLFVGDGNGELFLDDFVTETQAYILNRRLELK